MVVSLNYGSLNQPGFTVHIIRYDCLTERAPRGSDDEEEDMLGAYSGYYGEHEQYGDGYYGYEDDEDDEFDSEDDSDDGMAY